MKDIAGIRFGRLTALRPTAQRQHNKVIWECQCDCGRSTKVQGCNLRSGLTRSCGCLQPQRAAETQKARAKHGHAHRDGFGGHSRTYRSWMSAKQRCFAEADPYYHDYGGRGITMCDRWRYSFPAFLADMGERPQGKTLDRINSDGNYEPGNCRWATPMEQRHNRRPNVRQ